MTDGIPHRVRTAVRWRDLPERFGPWKTVQERRRRPLRFRLGRQRELRTRTHPVIGSPRLDPQAEHAAALVLKLAPWPAA
ncbi:transposase [Streptomyces sp. JH002]|uniref:transposase n=1 Tax=Streptomyces sp. JH002 TaxID=2763259 RepID=UPI003D80256D